MLNILRSLPDPEAIKENFPLSETAKENKARRDIILKDILSGRRNDLFLVIIGPCSADREDAVVEYTTKLKEVQDKTADKLFIVPRVL
jgi:3-deoxy-7-phosphoheptulonate synthase